MAATAASTSSHVLRLYRREEVAALLTATGFEVAVGEAYAPAGDGDRLPGWYVVTARKP